MFDETTTIPIDYPDLLIAAVVNLVAIQLFAVTIYFRRHRRKDLTIVFTFFCVCLFVVVSVIQMSDVAAALGFGLFAILSIIRLRSEPFSNREIGYFFGALVIGLVNGIGTPNLAVTIAFNVMILVAAFVLDHPNVLVAASHQRVVLDIVHTDPVLLTAVLEQRIGATISNYSVSSIDFVRDVMELEVQYQPQGEPAHQPIGSRAKAWITS